MENIIKILAMLFIVTCLFCLFCVFPFWALHPSNNIPDEEINYVRFSDATATASETEPINLDV